MSDMIRRARALGGIGLAWMGMPPPQTIGEYPSDRDLFAARWEKYGVDRHGQEYTRAGLQAELYILQAFDLIQIVNFDPVQVYEYMTLFKVTFRYTEEGAAAALDAWNSSKSDILPPYEF